MSVKTMRTRAKVCGITRVEDAQTAVAAGADALGFILHADSPRLIDLQKAKQIRQFVPPFVSCVGVVVDAKIDFARLCFDELRLSFLQLHGSETAEYAAELDLPYIKAIRARSTDYVHQQMREHGAASAYLLDPYVAGQAGGTGKTLSLDLWPTDSNKPLILAGGIGPDNVSDAVRQLKPFAVDMNSALEEAPGVKSIQKINAAFAQLNSI